MRFLGSSQSQPSLFRKSTLKEQEKRERGNGRKSSRVLLDHLACGESWANRVNLDLHFVARFGFWYKDYEAFDPSYSVSSTASLLDLKLILLTFLNRLVEGTFKAHAFHLVRFVQLVFREKTWTPTRMVTVGRFASARTANSRREQATDTNNAACFQHRILFRMGMKWVTSCHLGRWSNILCLLLFTRSK
jgi:hypothetical protein